MKLRPAKQEELKYCFPQPLRLIGPSGALFRVCGNLGDHCYHWEHYQTHSYSPAYSEVNALLRDAFLLPEGCTSVLGNLDAMRKYCEVHLECFYQKESQHGFCYTGWSEEYAYMMLLNPNKTSGNCQFSIICYIRACLERHIEDASNGIEFFDLSGNTVFRIADGDDICIKNLSGAFLPAVLNCRYTYKGEVDVGGRLYPLAEFAHVLDDDTIQVMPMRASLPDKCFGFDEKSGQLVEIRKGKSTMTTSILNEPEAPERNRKVAESYNHSLGITKAQAAAMLYGCIHGWELDGADPANYGADGNYLKTN